MFSAANMREHPPKTKTGNIRLLKISYQGFLNIQFELQLKSEFSALCLNKVFRLLDILIPERCHSEKGAFV